MKLAQLLAQFLYSHKRLDLPGIGSFFLDPGVDTDTAHIKAGPGGIIEGASFEFNPGVRESPGLVDFIASSSGKIKALAAADLETHLELAREFLNIGKPFLFEGIGSLTKMQSGHFSFLPGPVSSGKMSDAPQKETTPFSHQEEPMTDYKSILYAKKRKWGLKRPVGIALVVAGIALAIWGGYLVNKKTNGKKENETITTGSKGMKEQEQGLNVSENRPVPNNSDSVAAAVKILPPPGTFKFVIESAGRERALARYSLLRGYGLDVRMDTEDSLNYKLFFQLPAAASDTSRILDSLRIIYTPAGKKAHVEI